MKILGTEIISPPPPPYFQFPVKGEELFWVCFDGVFKSKHYKDVAF